MHRQGCNYSTIKVSLKLRRFSAKSPQKVKYCPHVCLEYATSHRGHHKPKLFLYSFGYKIIFHHYFLPHFPGVVLEPARLEDGSEGLGLAEAGVVGDEEVDLPQQGLGRQEYQRGADREVGLGDADAVVLGDTRLTVEIQIFL